MATPDIQQRAPVEWSVATRARCGEAANGDLAVVAALPDGVLFAAIDGLGHGDPAAHAARTAGEVIRARPTEDLVLLAKRCHSALRSTRGAAISLAFVSARDATMTWLGVGNVDGRVVSGDPLVTRSKGALALEGGVPGHELPGLSSATIDVLPGDVLILATDGIGSAFGDSLDTSGSTQAISDRILADHWKRTDDALVVAVRYVGGRP